MEIDRLAESLYGADCLAQDVRASGWHTVQERDRRRYRVMAGAAIREMTKALVQQAVAKAGSDQPCALAALGGIICDRRCRASE